MSISDKRTGILDNSTIKNSFYKKLNDIGLHETYDEVMKELIGLSNLSRQVGLIPMCEALCKNGILSEILLFIKNAMENTDVPNIYKKLLLVFEPKLLDDSLSSDEYTTIVICMEGMFQILTGETPEQIQLHIKNIVSG